jgi:HEAT repeats
MRKQRRNLQLAALLAVALVSALIWLALRPREPADEPVYEGKRLSEWLTFGRSGYFAPGAEDAIRHIGTNALPTLLQMLRANDSRLKLQFVALAQKQHFVRLHYVPAAQINWEAMSAFRVLGPTAGGAVPGLIKILDEKVSDGSQWSVIDSLGWIGPAASPAAPSLLRTVGDTNARPDARVNAAWALVHIQADPGLVVPALIKCLGDPNWTVRMDASESLGQMGSDAQAAVPALLVLLKDTNPNVRAEAEQALKTIDPEAAAQAGVK